MTQPTPYERGHSFTDFSESQPAAQQPGAQLDAEFDGVAETVGQILANLALIQRDDTGLRNGIVRLATLHSEVIAALTLIGASVSAWTTAISYTPGQILTDEDDIYLVAAAHTSGVLATDFAADRLIRIFDSGIMSDLLESTGATLVNYRHPLGTRTRSLAARSADVLLLTDFCAMDGSDETAGFQAFVNACSSDVEGEAPAGVIPAGQVRITGTITFPHKYCKITGAGPFSTSILCEGVTGAVFRAAAAANFKPHFEGFALAGDDLTGVGIDLSLITDTVFDCVGSDLFIDVGGHGIDAPRIFSGVLRRIMSYSSAGHSFKVGCGPSVSWENCYAKQAGPGKAGYRAIGLIAMYSCNGVDDAEYWGVFGQDPALGDGFAHDFAELDVTAPSFPWVTDYADVHLYVTNVEAFDVCGIKIHGDFRNFDVEGGKLDRSKLASDYTALIWLAGSPVVTGNPVELDFGYVFPGSGVPKGSGALTNAWLYASVGQPIIVDKSGAFGNVSITGMYTDAYAGLVPLLREKVVNDVPQDTARHFSAVAARRISARVIRYDTPAALTPVGSSQTIDVTGYTRVTVTPAAAASIAHAAFTQTAGAGLDNGRNGELIIEAGNANLTIKHNAAGAGGFRLTAGADLALASGGIARFVWSANYTAGVGGWVQA